MESYKQIKSDLDVLRQSVEKSELWVYKSSKPASTITANQQQHIGDEELQSQEQVTSQVSITDVTSVVTTPSINASETISSQPLKDITSTSETATDKVLGDTSTTDGSNGYEEEEDDEYRKIQKVTFTTLTYLLLNARVIYQVMCIFICFHHHC